MAGNSFGQAFRVTTAGESHGPGNVVIIDGVPPGIVLSVADLEEDLRRRRPGQSKITTQRNESDSPEILSGVFEGCTTGTSLAILIRNSDARSRDYGNLADLYRPGHADYTFEAKYGVRDYRGGGRSSARETNVRVAAGTVAKKIIEQAFGGCVVAYVVRVGDVCASVPDPAAVTLQQVETLPGGQANIVRCPDPEAAAAMVALIEKVRKEEDSIGGIAEVVATGVPSGLGEPVFDKLKADLGKALFTLPAVMGVEYGVGFGCANLRGSENNDIFTVAEDTQDAQDAQDAQDTQDTRDAQDAQDTQDAQDARDARTGGRVRSSGEVPTSKDSPLAATTCDVEKARDAGSTAAATARHSGKQAPPVLVSQTNRHGGMLGGISSGMPIVLRAAVKPTSSLSREQNTVTRSGEAAKVRSRGRHDPCLLPRFVPMAEAMVAIVLADHWLRWRGQRS